MCWWSEQANGVTKTNAISKGEQYHNTIAGCQSTARVLYILITILTFVILALIGYRFLR